MRGSLILIPNTLGDDPCALLHLTPEIEKYINELDVFIVENLKAARRFIKRVNRDRDISSLTFHEIRKKDKGNYSTYLDVAIKGGSIGLLSDAGIPSVADPGFSAVSAAQELDLIIKPLTGPSSIMLALSASGLNGQKFTFHGYLPIESGKRVKKLRDLCRIAREGATHIFMETPYRNNPLIEDILNNCPEDIKLCLAKNLTLEGEYIKTLTVEDWIKNKNIPSFNKKPTIFLLGY